MEGAEDEGQGRRAAVGRRAAAAAGLTAPLLGLSPMVRPLGTQYTPHVVYRPERSVLCVKTLCIQYDALHNTCTLHITH